MDLASIRTKVTDLAKKYKYVAIVLVIGVVLMLLPSNSAKKTTVQESQLPSGYQQTVEEALAELLKYTGLGITLTGFDEALFTEHVDHIIVFERTEIGFAMKCGPVFRERI